MDWASGHWPGIVPVCVGMRASCSGWGVLLWVRGAGIMVTGYKAHQDPCAPLRGDTWLDTRQNHGQAGHPPAEQPDGQMVASSSSVRQKKWNELICHHCVCFLCRLRDPLASGNNKDINIDMAHPTLLDFTAFFIQTILSHDHTTMYCILPPYSSQLSCTFLFSCIL